MAHRRIFSLPVAVLLAIGMGGAGALAQNTSSIASRLAGDWRSSAPVKLAASRPPLSLTAADQGSAAGSQALDRMILLLKPSAAQQQALAAELASLQDSSSSNYHQWLTPASFAASYANSAADVAAVAAWLEGEGFTVAPLPAGRGWIEFSGTVAQVEQAFGAQVHLVTASTGGSRAALMSDVTVPAALQPVIAGLVSLDGVVSLPAVTTPHALSVTAAELAAETTPASAEALTPRLEAQLIDLNQAQSGQNSSSSLTGAGQTIAIASRSNVNAADIAAFRAAFGLAASPLSVILNGSDPGLTDSQAEATLAASWAGAAAPGAGIVLAPAASTAATDGVDLSLAAIVDQQLAATAAVGYSACEAGMSPAHRAFYAALYEQAAAEGISVIAAAGDSGAAACALPGTATPVTSGYGVNAIASTPWNTAVGVAAFGASDAAAGSSALAGWSPRNTADPAYAGGGGNSTAYAIQKWQPLPALVPDGTSSSNRLVPDLSLPAAIDTGANPGVAFCLSAAASNGCTLVRAGGSGAAAGIFAGIAALIDQEHGAQGNLTPGLYAVTTQSGVYNDVEQGNSQLACAAGSPGCAENGQIGYSAASGYDLATGLGVPDAQALVNAFAKPMATGTATANVGLTVSPNQTSYNPSAAITLTATVSGSAGAPSGNVTFYDSTTGNNLGGQSPAVNGGSASITQTGGFALNANSIVAQYSGDTNYAANTSAAVSINIAASPTTLAITSFPQNVTPGQSIPVTVTLTVGNTPPAGTVAPSGLVSLIVDNQTQQPFTASLTGSGSTATATTNVTIPTNLGLTTHTITASFPGNIDYGASNASPVTLTVVAVQPAVTITTTPTSPQPGSNMTVNVTVAGKESGEITPTGSVAVSLDGTPVGAVTLGTSGSGALAITAPTNANGSSHTLTGVYTPDSASSNYYTTATGQDVFTVSLIPTTTTNNASTTTPSLGGSVTVNTTVAPSTGSSYYSGQNPTGTVTYTLDGTNEGSANVTQGQPSTASTSFTVTTSGSHTLIAAYSGDNYYAASTASTVLTVSKINSATTLQTSPASPAVGTPLTVTATVAASPAGSSTTTPTGTVSFTLGGSVVGSGTLNNGVATAELTVPSAGSLTLSATYQGDTNYSGSTATASVTAVKATPTVAVSSSTSSPGVCSTVQLTATVSVPGATGVTAPAGSVTFFVDGAQAGVASVSGGEASLTVNSALTVGTHQVTATYGGDSNYNGATSTSSFPLTVTTGNVTLSVTPSTTTPAPNSTLGVTATLATTGTCATTVPTGTVSFYMDGASIGSGTVTGGTTAILNPPLTAPATGIHTLTATYSGNANFNQATGSATFTVAKITTVTTVIPATVSPSLGSSLPVNITVSPAAVIQGISMPGNYVTVTVDGAAVGLAQLTQGAASSTATFTIPAQYMTPGSHTIAGAYSGDNYYATSTSAGTQVTVPKISTTTTVAVVAATLNAGGTVSVTATIAPTTTGTQLPTGTVTFYLDGASAATAAVLPGSPATATANILSLTAGTHTLTAAYGGDTYYASSTSNSVPLTVSKSSTTIAITPSSLAPTAGGSMIVTADVSALVAASQGTVWPSGAVTITMDGVAAATGTLTPGSPSVANVTVPLVAAGTHVLGAAYPGDTNYTGSSTASAITITAAKGSTTTTVTATPASLVSGTAETLTAAVAPVGAVTGITYTITGSVSFYDTTNAPASASGTTTTDGKTLLGTVAVGSGNTATLAGLDLDANISHSIVAIYSGDANWLTSTSDVLPLAATTLPDTVVLTSNYSTAAPGAAIIFTATVTPNSIPTTGGAYPTGTVVFYNGSTPIGTATLAPVANSLTYSSAATLTIQTLPGGAATVTAYYKGDDNYDANVSNKLTLTVMGFTITPDPSNPATNLDIVQGGAGSVIFDILGQGGFDGVVQVECYAPPQDNMTCTATPQQVTPPGTVTFVVQTSSGTTIAQMRRQPLWPHVAGGAALAGLVFFLLPWGRRARTLVRHGGRRAFLLVLLLAGLAGAGIGCTNNSATSTGSGSGTATPLGVATLKVTAQSYVNNTTVSQSVSFTVNVIQPGTVTTQ